MRSRSARLLVGMACPAILAVVGNPAASRAQPYFTERPDWSSTVANFTRMIAVGDIDGDGLLDLVCANSGHPNTLYAHRDGTLGTGPVWSSQAANESRSVALGDVDGDGDLDAVFANRGQKNELYENVGGMFASDPVWESEPELDTRSLALGDIDGDGDLDLVCGNSGASNTVYLNTGGTFSTSPDWSSVPTNNTRRVALGDINGDGRLDLVCANTGGSGQPNVLYLNTGTALADTVTWSSPLKMQSLGMALGDVDGDGDLDVVFGNQEGVDTLYLNTGTVFADTTAWTSDPATATHDLAFGDVDADGDLDLVAGNSEEANLLYLNQEGALSTSPAWDSELTNGTKTVVLADVDADGDLDMICGNGGQPSGINTIYRNELKKLAPVPSWQSGVLRSTRALALGDVDGDHAIDLVCGNRAGESTLYRNTAGALEALPSWTSVETADVMGVALGDVDGDGRVDLVLGNSTQENSLYLNIGGTFSATPVWTSPDVEPTWAVTLGDIDQDGGLDLICGNRDGANTLYSNVSGTLTQDPVWSSNAANATTSVAVGDLDGDGDLDLVCGNAAGANVAYEGDGGTFSLDPTWFSGPTNDTQAVALGDIDGDGTLDLVCANGATGTGEVNTLYLNRGGLSTSPSWSSGPAVASYGVSLGDVDGDGDLDVVFANDGFDHLYLNEGGTISTSPSWQSERLEPSQDVVMGDVDFDGDLDAVFATGSDVEPLANELYLGLMNPDLPRGTEPRYRLPNNDAFIENVRVLAAGENRLEIRFTAIDVESDPIWVLPAYHYEGQTGYEPASVSNLPERIGPFPTSPEGSDHGFEWDTSIVPFDSRNIELRLLAPSLPRRTTPVQRIPSYFTRLGVVTPLRAQLSLSTSSLQFPIVTVGDTVALDLSLRNDGNRDLMITALTGLPDDVEVDRSLPLTISPGPSPEVMRFQLHPVNPSVEEAMVQISSNDPTDPEKELLLFSEVLGLEFTSRVVNDQPTLPLNEAVTVVATPSPGVHVEGASLYYRTSGSPVFETTSFSPLDEAFVALIPAHAVTESGLDFYVEVFNSGVFATDPAGAPATFFTREVEIPAEVELDTIVFPNSENGFEEGTDVSLTVELPPGFEFVHGRVHARRGGETTFQQIELDPSGALPRAAIPASLVQSRGVEYWIEVETLTRTLTAPRVDPTRHPFTLAVTVLDLEEPTQHPGGGYRMVSVPLDFGHDQTKTLEAILADQTAFGPYDPLNWRSFRYLAGEKRYAEFGAEPEANHFVLDPGKAFWLIARAENRIATAPVDGRSTATDEPFLIPLDPGWNQIGTPFDFPVAWESVLVDTVAVGTDSPDDLQGPVAWIAGRGYVQDVATLAPFEGYWIKNLTQTTLSLRVPPVEAASAEPSRGVIEATAEPVNTPGDSDATWSIELTASAGGVLDPGNVLGVHGDASTNWDVHDRAEPPSPPGRFLSLYFPHADWGSRADRYDRDIRSAYPADPADLGGVSALDHEAWGHVWRLDVARDFGPRPASDVTIAATGLERVPQNTAVLLLDLELDRVVDLRERPEYRFFQGNREVVRDASNTRFALVVGGEGFASLQSDELTSAPKAVALYENYPNPFNPVTVIRYDLAHRGRIDLRVYNVRGALVAILDTGVREAGRYEVPWYGTSSSGERVASGVYFYQLTTPERTITRKMTLLR